MWIGFIPTINKEFSLHTIEWERTACLGLEHVVRCIVVLKSNVILLVRSPLFQILLLFSTQSYSGTLSLGETDLQMRNGLLCVNHSQIFLLGFILLTEPSSCVPGDINCNKEDMVTMSSFTQDDAHQSIDIQLFIWERGKVDRRWAKGNKERWYCVFCGNEYNIWNPTKALMKLTILGDHKIARCRGEILPKYQCKFKELKEKK